MKYFSNVTFKQIGNYIIFLTAVGLHQVNIS